MFEKTKFNGPTAKNQPRIRRVEGHGCVTVYFSQWFSVLDLTTNLAQARQGPSPLVSFLRTSLAREGKDRAPLNRSPTERWNLRWNAWGGCINKVGSNFVTDRNWGMSLQINITIALLNNCSLWNIGKKPSSKLKISITIRTVCSCAARYV